VQQQCGFRPGKGTQGAFLNVQEPTEAERSSEGRQEAEGKLNTSPAAE